MANSRPLILVTNDDGIMARGLEHLVEIAVKFGDVVVVAPAEPQSGKSSSITVDSAVRLAQHANIGEARVFSVTGTPVDCVKVGLHAVLDRKPDLLLSGINHGSNAAINNIYSGTMGAAMEGCILQIPSIGFSVLSHDPKADFDQVTPYIESIITTVLEKGLPAWVCLNVNFPSRGEIQGMKVVQGALGHWTEEYTDYATPNGQPFFWLTGKFVNDEPDNDKTDEYWLKRAYGTIVPIRPEQTAYDVLTDIQKMF